eukprot:TRINITY_DN14913_c0_g1_i1.p1 TRINITY_DN14913_c0_g1~~TRINITY_DN14913_c0_g1_i1.p1  ORF type:complete len:418 (-),score=73.68 TRINITY_DN14913_c0_g1_i1:8-1237(-)
MLRLARSTPRIALRHYARFNTGSPQALTVLPEEERQLVDAVRQLATTVIAPRVAAMDKAGVMDKEVIAALFDQGLMGIETPAEYGGSGMSFMSSILVIEELAKVDPSVSVLCDVQNTLVTNAFLRFAHEGLRKQYLPQMAKDTVGSFCLSESSSGSDAFALKCRATPDGPNHFRLNGSKMWITNSGEAGVFLVMATVDPALGYKGITCFAVDRANPGLQVGKREDKLGIRSSSTCEVILTDCRVSNDDIVGELGKGYKIAIETLNEGRIGIAAQMLGLAEGALETALPYLYQRKQFGQFIGDFQGMQHQVAQVATDIQAAKLLTYNAARLKDNGQPFVQEAAMAKLFASQVAERAASKAVEWVGGLGFTRDFPIEKFYRDAKIGAIYEGTSNIQLNTIAKALAEPHRRK